MTSPSVGPRSGGRDRPSGLIRLGSVAGIDVTVSSSWFIVAAVIAFLIAPLMNDVSPGLGNLAYVAGAAFAVLLYLSTLLHELAHALAARRFGMVVHSINLNFFGGATAIEDRSNSPRREFVIAIVGPLTSIAVGLLAWSGYRAAEPGLLRFTVGALAVSNLIVGVLNLVPGLPLDGGRVLMAAVWGASGNRDLATKVAGWGGRAAAVAALSYPLVLRATGHLVGVSDFMFAVLVGLFLWAGATEALRSADLMRRLPGIRAVTLARPAIAVPYDLPIAEGVRRAALAQAGALIVVDGHGSPTGLVSEHAVLSTPEDRRPWVTCGEMSRNIDDDLRVSVDSEGEQLIKALQRHPATEYVVLRPDGAIYGVLSSRDVVKAMRRS